MENFLRSAFGEKNCFTFGVLHQYRHHATGEVEWDLVQLLILRHIGLPVEVRTLRDRPVEQILETGLEVTNQVPV
jgi:hypothetical protein